MNAKEKKVCDDAMEQRTSLHTKTCKEIQRILQEQSYEEVDILATAIATLCKVDKDHLFSKKNMLASSVQARWLFWYSLRYATRETHAHIANVIYKNGTEFTRPAISFGIRQMSQMISTDKIWEERWAVIKFIIKQKHIEIESNTEPQKVTIIAQKGVEFNIQRI